MGQVGKVDPKIQMAAIKPYLILQEDKAFQAWQKTIEGELDQLKGFSWQLGGIDRFGQFDSALNEMGMMRPQNQAEMLQLWMCFRAVVNYWSAKMQYLRDMRLKYEYLEKHLKLLTEIEEKDEKRKKGGKR